MAGGKRLRPLRIHPTARCRPAVSRAARTSRWYYSLALDRGYSYDTTWNDRVRTEVDPVTGEEWTPQNIDGTDGQTVNLERALVWSKNPPALEIFKTLGKRRRQLGASPGLHHADPRRRCAGAGCIVRTHRRDLTRLRAVRFTSAARRKTSALSGSSIAADVCCTTPAPGMIRCWMAEPPRPPGRNRGSHASAGDRAAYRLPDGYAAAPRRQPGATASRFAMPS